MFFDLQPRQGVDPALDDPSVQDRRVSRVREVPADVSNLNVEFNPAMAAQTKNALTANAPAETAAANRKGMLT
jgi:hypothetical protein